MNPFATPEFQNRVNRRTFLGRSGLCLGGFALANLLSPHLARGVVAKPQAASAASSGTWRGVLNPPHLPVRAKRVIHLCMAGGPSHLESFDPKPALKKLHGQAFP